MKPPTTLGTLKGSSMPEVFMVKRLGNDIIIMEKTCQTRLSAKLLQKWLP